MLLIFGWHNVEYSCFFPCLPGAGVTGLQQQLEFLKRFAHVVPLSHALEKVSQRQRLPSRSVCITFDDGYRDVLELAIPLLKRLSLPATFFLVPGILSGQECAWWEDLAWAVSRTTRGYLSWEGQNLRLDSARRRQLAVQTVAAELKRRDRSNRQRALRALISELHACPRPGRLFMDWDDAQELVREGFEVGSHSMCHDVLAHEAVEDQTSDLIESRRQLEEMLGVEVTLLAYPNGTNGDYTDATIDVARRAGYKYAITTRGGWIKGDPARYEIRRQMVERSHGVPGLLRTVAGATGAVFREGRCA